MNHTNCNCAECQRLDALPVRRHGIPHARQTTFIGGHDPRPIDFDPHPWPGGDLTGHPGYQKEHDSLPLFGTLAPDLFA